MLGPCWHIFRSWVRLERFFRVLLRLSCLLVVFFAFWRAPGSILEASGSFRRGFWSLRALIFRGFALRARLYSPTAQNVTKPQFYWIGTQFASIAHNARNCKKSLREPFERACLGQSRPKRVLGLAGLVFGRVWEPPGLVLGASGTLLGSF